MISQPDRGMRWQKYKKDLELDSFLFSEKKALGYKSIDLAAKSKRMNEWTNEQTENESTIPNH